MRISNLVLFGVALSMTFATGCSLDIFYNPENNPNSAIYNSNQCGYDVYYGYYCAGEHGEAVLTRDVTTSVAEAEQAQVEVTARHYSRQFHLASEQGMKIAKTIRDYNALSTRSEQDVAEISRRLYGLDPSRVISAVRDAQLGQSEHLNEVVSDAAKNFGTTPENMREIVKTLHGTILREQGIQF